MALTPIRQMDLSIHGKMLSVIESLLADSAVSTDKIAAQAVTEAKIAPNTITNASIAQTASISDAALAVISSAGKVANSATTATSANTADAIVARDANGGFSAGDVNVADLSASGDLSIAGSFSLTGGLDVNNGKLVVDAASGDLSMDGALDVGGNAVLGGTLAVAGDLAVDTNKFTVAAATGNTVVGGTLAVAGNLAVDTNKFTVDAASGDTGIAGDLSVAGETTLTGNVLASGDVTIQGNLAVNGTTTSVNSVDLVVNDRLVHLNEPSVAGANDPVPTGLSGISIHRGSDAGAEREHAGMVWDEAAQKFVFQMLDADAAGSTKLDLEAKNLLLEELVVEKTDQWGNHARMEANTGGLQLIANNSGSNSTDFSIDSQGVSGDIYDGTNGTWLQVHPNEFHIERTADDYASYSQFDIDADGVRLRDSNGDALLPTLGEHLVVKQYVDDATATMQGNVDLKYDKAGGAIDVDGTVELSITDGASAILSGEKLEIGSDHTSWDAVAVVNTSFGLDSVSMSYTADSGETYSAALSSGTFELNFNGTANDAFGVIAQMNNFAVGHQMNGDDTQLYSDSGLIKLQAGEFNANAIALEVTKTGAKLVNRDTSAVNPDTPFVPVDDAHLVVKKYVDDADAALQDQVDEILTKSGIVIGTQNTYSTTNVVANGDSLVDAIGKIDNALADIAGKSYHEAFIYAAAGGETSLAKPMGAPAIPDSAFTEVYIDGRKVFRGADKQFTVAVGGGSISFAALAADQTVELRYFA